MFNPIWAGGRHILHVVLTPKRNKVFPNNPDNYWSICINNILGNLLDHIIIEFNSFRAYYFKVQRKNFNWLCCKMISEIMKYNSNKGELL